MQNTKKVLNLIVLIGFLVSNFLTPLSYAVDDLDLGGESDSLAGGLEGHISPDLSGSSTSMEDLGIGEFQDEQQLDEINGGGQSDVIHMYDENNGNVDLMDANEGGLSLNAANFSDQIKLASNGIEISYGTTTYTTTLTGDNTTMNNFSYKTITVGDYVIMDRNLGATEEWIYDDEWANMGSSYNYGRYLSPIDSYGYYYQWGNNYGFSPNTTEAGVTGAITVADEYIPSKYSSPNWNRANPWSTQNDLWGDITQTSNPNNTGARQGPCPYGWHVPSQSEWSNIYNAWNGSLDKSGTTPKDFAKDLKLPPNGRRDYYTTIFSNLSYYGYYWSSTPNGSNKAYDLNFDASNFYWSSNDYRSYGFSVRCVQSFPTQTITFHADQGTITPESITVEKGTTTTAPVWTNDNADGVTWYEDESFTIEFDFTAEINADYDLYAKWTCKDGYMQNASGTGCENIVPELNSMDIVIQATATSAEQTLTINKYFDNVYTVDWGDGTTGDLTSNTTHTYTSADTYNIILSLTGSATRWLFQMYNYAPLVPKAGTTMTNVKITSMPSLVDGFGSSTTDLGIGFFKAFNYNGALTSLPEGSFDTSYITAVVGGFFEAFNWNGELINLPTGSFNLSGITTAGANFFKSFNYNGKLTSLPEGSFDISHITTAEASFFDTFNKDGALTGLPDGSFDTSHITTVKANFFSEFNNQGALTSLPRGSFDTSKITKVGGEQFFGSFNNGGALTSLPEGSFSLSGITDAGWGNFFTSFNKNGALTSLPEGSFDISHITGVGGSFFSYFNYGGALTSLPTGSFRLSTGLVRAGEFFFTYFNENGALTSLPEGSFDLSHITTVGWYFFAAFNQNGHITYLPDSFKLTSAAYDQLSAYAGAFNSSNYTLNRKVSDLVAGVTNLSSDGDVFSDNQPGRCGVYATWLVNTANQCANTYYTVTFNTNGGSGSYYAQTVISGNLITEPTPSPTKDGVAFGGWYRDNGTFQNKWNFATDKMTDDITLYAKWKMQCPEGYVDDGNGGCVKVFTVAYDANGHGTAPSSVEVVSGGKLTEPTPAPTAEGYIFKGWYKEAGCINAWDFESDTVTGDITLYTKWHKDSCAENEEWYEEISACATRDADNIVYYWMDENGKGVISIISGDTILTMLDKNEGANVAGLGEDSYGELYQRGNNAPIKTASTSTDRAEYKNYWPGHSFYDATFRYGSTMYDYWQNGSTDNDTHYNNLWGGSGDDTAGDWGGINNGDMRQGPCDTGYHVPSIMEWESVLHIFASIVGQDLKGSTLHHFTNSTNAGKFKNAFKLPFPGFRYSNTSLLEYQGSIGYYWSSSPYYGDDRPNNARTFYLNSSYVDANGSNLRTTGNPVRCFKDSTSAPATRTITFNENGGDILGAEGTDGQGILIQKVENGKLAQAPIGVIKDGATFSHWENVSDNSEFDLSTMDITQDVTLRAMWDITLYNITYHLDGGTQSSPKTGYTIEDETFTLVNPTRERYIFAGWTGSNGNELQTTVTITQGSKYEDLEYYANWYEDFNDNGQNDADETKYTVIYTDGVEEEVFEDEEYSDILSGGATPAFGGETTRSGYVFSGWNPAVADKVLETVTYEAEWKVDSNNNGIADEDESHFTVTYTDGVAEEVFADQVIENILSGSTTPAFGGDTTRSGYVFSGWNPAVAGTVTADVTYTAIWGEDKNHNGIDDSTELVAITFNAGNHGKVNNSTKYTTDKIYLPGYNNYPAAPSPIADNGWKFAQWSPTYKVGEMIPLSGAELEYTAQWNSNGGGSSSSGGGGGGGGSTKPDTPKEEQKPVETPKETLQKEDQQESSLETQDDEQNTKDSQQMDQTSDKSSEGQDNRGIKSSGNSYTKEQEEAYEFARSNGITTKSTIQEANMNGNLTRIQMAKMLSQYAINVLGKTPDTSKIIKFNDVTDKRNRDYDNGVTLAYQLGIMGQNMKDNKFRPDNEVSRSELVTALSRLLYNTSDGEYKSTSKYYIHHMEKLKKEGIITKDDPKMKERRGYVMIMLMRSAK